MVCLIWFILIWEICRVCIALNDTISGAFLFISRFTFKKKIPDCSCGLRLLGCVAKGSFSTCMHNLRGISMNMGSLPLLQEIGKGLRKANVFYLTSRPGWYQARPESWTSQGCTDPWLNPLGCFSAWLPTHSSHINWGHFDCNNNTAQHRTAHQLQTWVENLHTSCSAVRLWASLFQEKYRRLLCSPVSSSVSFSFLETIIK